MKRNIQSSTNNWAHVSTQGRYVPYLFSEGCWVIYDSLKDSLIEGSSKATFDLSQEACNAMNQRYQESMERQRKQHWSTKSMMS